ncbi:Rv3654c family TadE-like protein [Streptomyces uncialis]|uniref:Rv3654c family TadE-like protein n=1 Tax=Streptomyces uncialis TaxID=1048205 RepID=UPI00386DFE2A|nr:flp pilus-assembly TadE/G-like family protein [Streptomyces uncialis]
MAVAVMGLVFGVLLAMSHAMVVRHKAAGAADLAALAAAEHWAAGQAGACARARVVAGAQEGRLVRCVLNGEVVDVTATVGEGLFAAEMRSRAGPATATLPGVGAWGLGPRAEDLGNRRPGA